ncbi:murein L,D-transpeptidase catalytic domain family protein [Phenylobacterium sp.]|jgi:hypothetical protein|uniref:murein L,D-transpeptidase catalytic domain family protein n=1 Tax=Phenylobacterium sp. TaxID=1871053 RepID=UPI002F3F79D8
MTEIVPATRRGFLRTSFAALGAAIGTPALAFAAPGQSGVLAAARAGLAQAGGRVAHSDVVGVADFSQPSCTPRFHLVDLAGGKVESLLVAHGRGSDPDHSGWLRRFSNDLGSAATSEGRYLTGEYYTGQHGRSMRLQGLDPTNDNAYARAIVVHAAWYVSPQMASEHGILGRSEGCFAVSQADLGQVLDRLGRDRLIVATKL